MAGRKRTSQKIDPSFSGSDKRDDELSIEAGERVTAGRSSAKAERPSKPRKASNRNSFDDRPRSKREPRQRSRGFFGLIRFAVYWCLIIGIWGAIGLGGLVFYYGSKMPSANTWEIPARPPNVKINGIDGSTFANRGATGGEALNLNEMSPYIPEAVIAIEDRRFYSHFGIDPFGLARALVTNVMTGHSVQGGSTLTQQLAKNLFLSPERTLERKVQEALLALWLEHHYTKDQILTMYLNRVFFGSNAFGVEAASRRYFNKSARDVNLGEAALLAGLVKAPSRLSPARDPQAAEARAQVVLQAMRDQGYISDSDVTTAMSQPPTRAKSSWTGAQNYVADMVMDQLPGLIGKIHEDIVVDTTIDPALEAEAEKSLNDVLNKDGGKLNASQAALVSLDGTGAIRALVGGRDYAESQFNRAVTAKRQPGSAFKPFVYAAALEKGLTPNSVRNDAPVKIGNWTPENYEQKYNGPVTLATALAHSLNTIAAQLVMEVGPEQVIKLAHRLGIQSDLQNNASIALGTSEVSLQELTGAYASFMNGGFKATPHVIAKVTTVSGKVLYQANFADPPRVLSDAIAANMDAMMAGVITSGTGKAAKLPNWQAAGKSGTTQSFRDALFVGFTSNLTTGVWVGNDDGHPMKKVTGGTLPAKAWKEFMIAAHKGLSPSPIFGGGQFVETGPAVAQSNGQTLEGIISSQLGVDNQQTAANPAGGEPVDMPPMDPASDANNPYASQSRNILPPANVGEPLQNDAPHPRKTTLLDIILGR